MPGVSAAGGGELSRVCEGWREAFNDADKAKLKKLNEEEAVLSNTFMNKLLAGTKAGGLQHYG